jgi:hypothetical protein
MSTGVYGTDELMIFREIRVVLRDIRIIRMQIDIVILKNAILFLYTFHYIINQMATSLWLNSNIRVISETVASRLKNNNFGCVLKDLEQNENLKSFERMFSFILLLFIMEGIDRMKIELAQKYVELLVIARLSCKNSWIC